MKKKSKSKGSTRSESKKEQFDKLCKKMADQVKAGKRVTVTDIKKFRRLEKALVKEVENCDPLMVYSFRQAENYSGINRGNLHRYVQQGRLKRQGQGFLKADLDNLAKDRNNPTPRYPVHEKIRVEQLKYQKWKAKREEIIVKMMQEKLVDLEDVKVAFTARAYELNSGLTMMSRRISHTIASAAKKEYKEVIEIIDAEVRRFQEIFSSESKYP